MRHLTACICMLILLGSASGQTKQSPTRPTPAVVIAPVGSGAKLDPVTLTRASLDEKVITLRLSPRVATSIRMPEPVNSVVIGDPERFQAEHSEHEPELVTVKPVSAAPAQTNLLITTTLGHQLNLLLISSGQQSGGTQTVDVLLKYGKPTGGSFLVEESPLSASLVAETQKLDVSGKPPELASIGPQVTSLAGLIKAASVDTSSTVDEKSGAVLDKLLDRQKRASLPVLYAQHPGADRCRTANQSGRQRGARPGTGCRCSVFRSEPGEPCDRDSAATSSAWRQGQEKVDNGGAVARNRFPIEHEAFGRRTAGGWSCGF